VPIYRSLTCTDRMHVAKNAIIEFSKGFFNFYVVTGCGVAQFVNENLLIVSTLASAVSFCNSPGFVPIA
jgi:hypothetical protein